MLFKELSWATWLRLWYISAPAKEEELSKVLKLDFCQWPHLWWKPLRTLMGTTGGESRSIGQPDLIPGTKFRKLDKRPHPLHSGKNKLLDYKHVSAICLWICLFTASFSLSSSSPFHPPPPLKSWELTKQSSVECKVEQCFCFLLKQYFSNNGHTL